MKGSGFLAGNVARLLDPEHPCSEANSLPRVPYFLQVLFIDWFCFLDTRSYSVAQEGKQLTILPMMTSNK